MTHRSRVKDAPPAEPREPHSAGDDSEGIASLLRRAAPVDDRPTGSLLPGVQRRLRRRSRGKFFANGWSTGSPRLRLSEALVALAMLAVLGVAYAVVAPVAFSAP